LRADEAYKIGHADCEDLAAWRAAELRRAGVAAMAVAKRSGKKKFHAVVVFPDGTYEDPSRRLGMKKGQ
jgi:predicted transglutaminase-like cysteine proteinase